MPGLKSDPTINGVHVDLPREIDLSQAILATPQKSGSGRATLDRAYHGEGLPDVLDAYEFELVYEVNDESEETAEWLEVLRVTPGPHDLAIWRERYAHYTAIEGQTVIYLPRADAYGQDYTGRTGDEFKATVTLIPISAPSTEESVTVVYEESVTEASSVDSGEVAISKEPMAHPKAKYRVALCKFGDALSAGDKIIVKYHPLFAVDVVTASTKFPPDRVGHEEKAIYLAEVDG